MAPRHAVGSSNLSEIVLSLVVVLTLLATHQFGLRGASGLPDTLRAVAGLVAGGVPAAAFGGALARRIPRRPLSFAIGALAIGLGFLRIFTGG